jgi:hypothetical protein
MRVSRIQRFSSAENYYIESVALSDVNYLNYSRLSAKTSEYLGSGCFIGILGSLVVLVASPLVCIDYSDWKFNSTRYGKWALGSAIGLGASLSVLVAAIHFDNRKIYFKPVGQSRNIKIWSFKRQ